jgi:hypothetical protein
VEKLLALCQQRQSFFCAVGNNAKKLSALLATTQNNYYNADKYLNN